MAQNPNARYASAREFREALRRVGRVERIGEMEFVAHDAPFEASVVDNDDVTLIASMRVDTKSRLGSHAIAAVFVILLAAYGVFCSYYPWKLPTTMTQQAVGTTAPAAVSEDHQSINR